MCSVAAGSARVARAGRRSAVEQSGHRSGPTRQCLQCLQCPPCPGPFGRRHGLGEMPAEAGHPVQRRGPARAGARAASADVRRRRPARWRCAAFRRPAGSARLALSAGDVVGQPAPRLPVNEDDVHPHRNPGSSKRAPQPCLLQNHLLRQTRSAETRPARLRSRAPTSSLWTRRWRRHSQRAIRSRPAAPCMQKSESRHHRVMPSTGVCTEVLPSMRANTARPAASRLWPLPCAVASSVSHWACPQAASAS